MLAYGVIRDQEVLVANDNPIATRFASVACYDDAVSGATGTNAGPRQFGPYLLHEQLGRGGMAMVHRAESRNPDSFGCPVALKCLLADNEFDTDFELVRSFVEEARLATRLHHPNIARTYSLGKFEGTYYIAMEYVPGPTLLQVAHRCEIVGALPVPIVVHMLIQICDALDHVHNLCDDAGTRLGIIHRDVSLSNIIVSSSGVVKLIDFGIAKGHTTHARTRDGTIKGKFGYVAPEYLAGRIDSRADLFAVGVIAHELITGRRLFQGHNDLDTIKRLRAMAVEPPSHWRPEVSPELDRVVMTALARDPDRRWQTASEIRAALQDVLDELGAVDERDTRDWVDRAFNHPVGERELAGALASLPEPTVAVDLATQLVDDAPAEDEPTTVMHAETTTETPLGLQLLWLIALVLATCLVFALRTL